MSILPHALEERKLAKLLTVVLFTAFLALTAAPGALAQGRTVTGVVSSADSGDPIPGVNVVVPGTTIGTATDADGSYALEGVPATADSLVFTFIGYEAKSIPIAGRSIIDVVLEPAVAELGDVVVIGYGEKSEALLTESVESVGAEEIGDLPIADPTQALAGRVAGVQITTTGAGPGSPSSVRIRGVGTTGNTQPLYVVDGVPIGRGGAQLVPGGQSTNPLTTINPADIASISVLKGASAAAVYGVRAANGVILIETKEGRGAPSISFNSYIGVQTLPRYYEFNSASEYFALREEAYANYNAQFGDTLRLHPTLREGSELRNIDNRDIFRDAALNENALIQNYNLSASGGNQDLNYYISGGYRTSESNVIEEGLKRYSFRLNSDYNVTDWLRIGEHFTVSRTEEEFGSGPRSLATETSTLPPFFSIYDVDDSVPGRYLDRFTGNLSPVLGGETQLGGFTTTVNPVAEYTAQTTQINTNRLLGGLEAEVFLPIDGLSFQTEASLDYRGLTRNLFRFPVMASEAGISRGDRIARTEIVDYTRIFTNRLTYDADFGKHSINALALAELQRIDYHQLGGQGSDLISYVPSCRILSCAGTLSNPGEAAAEQTFRGYLGRITYDYANKYLLTASLRRDGTSAFAPGNRWGTFPAVSAGWRVTEESFMDAVPVLSTLKLRGSWGQLGNASSVSPYAYVRGVTFNTFTATYGVGEEYFTTAQLGGFVNRNLTWETVETTDFGVNMGFFDDRLTAEATYYRRETKDLLVRVPISNVSGFGSAPVNLGSILNTGLELEAGYFDTFGDFTVDISANLTTLSNELTSLREGVREFTQNGVYRTAVGQPIGYLFGYVTDGIINTQEELQAARALDDKRADAGTEPQLGDVKFVDFATLCTPTLIQDGQCEEGQRILREPDGIINAADRTYLGKTIPDLYYGLNVNMSWRNFDLGLFLTGESGVSRYNAFRRFNLGLGGGGRNALAASQERYSEDNQDATLPRAVANDPNNNGRFSDLWVEDASYLRLKNVQLGYSVPPSLVAGAFERARIYVSVSNVFTITGYNGLDPTVRQVIADPNASNAQVGTQLAAGTDSGLLPIPRTYRVGLQMQF